MKYTKLGDKYATGKWRFRLIMSYLELKHQNMILNIVECALFPFMMARLKVVIDETSSRISPMRHKLNICVCVLLGITICIRRIVNILLQRDHSSTSV